MATKKRKEARGTLAASLTLILIVTTLVICFVAQVSLSIGLLLTAAAAAAAVTLVETKRPKPPVNKDATETLRALSHDLRKPFSLMHMGLGMLRTETDPTRRTLLLDRLSQQVSDGLATIDAKIQGQINGSSRLAQSPLKPKPDALDNSDFGERHSNDPQAVATIVNAYAHTGMPLKVLVIDDEPLYSEAIHALIEEDPALSAAIEFHAIGSGDAALRLCTEVASEACGQMPLPGGSHPHVIICDIDLGPTSPDGYETVSRLRHAGIAAKICIHSNRALPQDYQNAIQVGADAFLPKPMNRAHLLRLLASVHESEDGIGAAPALARRSNQKPLVALLDDDHFILEAWELSTADDVELKTYSHPDKFFAALAQDNELMSALSLVITDYYFDETYDGTGVTVAKALQERLPTVPIVLSSDGLFSPEETKAFAAVIGKTPQTLAAIKLAIHAQEQARVRGT